MILSYPAWEAARYRISSTKIQKTTRPQAEAAAHTLILANPLIQLGNRFTGEKVFPVGTRRILVRTLEKNRVLMEIVDALLF